MRVSLLLFFVLFVAVVSSASLGDGLWRTFNLALLGKAPALPLTVQEAKQQDWQPMDGICHPELGIRYAYKGIAPTKSTPLTIYFTSAGQVAGLAADIYGEGAAPQNLINRGLWMPVSGQKNQWTINASFRSPQVMCSGEIEDEVIGDRVAINQGVTQYSIPLTAGEAYCDDWTFGSCMKTMGQHWFYDVMEAPNLSWESGNLLPIVAMYYPPTVNGTLNAFFFTTPVAQPGSDFVLYKPGDWEVPDLTPSMMCENFCNDTCNWQGVDSWSTMHIYLNSQWSYISCDGGHGPLSIYCPETMYTECNNK